MTARGRSRRWLAGAVALALSACALGFIAVTGQTARAAVRPVVTLTTQDPPPASTDTTTTDTSSTDATTTATSVAPEPVQVQVTQEAATGPLPAGFLGFSTEFSALHAYLGRDPKVLNPVFVQLLTGVAQGQSPILRVGGNSTDATWLPLPGVLPPQNVNYALTPDWLATVHALVQQTNARLILGVNLSADDPQITGVEARALVNGIGSQYIEDLEIGNEPDLYDRFPWYQLLDGTEIYHRPGGYPFRSYLGDLNRWREILPHLPIAAGALAILAWLPGLDSLVATYPDVSMVTLHRYPLSNCGGTTGPEIPSIPNLLSSFATEGLAAPLAPYAAALTADGRQLRIDELNSASCEGTAGVSDTFASSLWVLNELFDMAAAGVSGINIHTLPGSAYGPFAFAKSGGHWTGVVRPLYYGLLAFASADPAGAEMLTVSDSSLATGGDVKAYATETGTGTIRTTIINEDASAPAEVALTLPTTTDLSAETLTAPSLSSTSGVQLGGRSFADPTTTGRIGAPQTSTLSSSGGSYDVSVPAGSAVVLTSGG